MPIPRGNTVFNDSVSGWLDGIRLGTQEVQVSRVKPSEKYPDSKLYNVKQIYEGRPKEMYFRCFDEQMRPFIATEDGRAVIQNAQCETALEGYDGEPIDDDLDVARYDEVFSVIARKVCEDAGLNPDLFPPKYTTQDRNGVANIWYGTPQNGAKGSKEWTFGNWLQEKGFCTFRINSACIVEAGTQRRGNHVNENYVSFKLTLGRNKFQPNRSVAETTTKRKRSSDLEAEKKVQVDKGEAAPPVKKVKLSKKAKELIESAPVEPSTPGIC